MNVLMPNNRISNFSNLRMNFIPLDNPLLWGSHLLRSSSSGDTVDFSNSNSSKKIESKAVMKETVEDVLELANENHGYNFSQIEKNTIKNGLKNFKSEVNTASILKELLSIELDGGNCKIDVDTILNYFQCINGATAPQVTATLRLLNHYAFYVDGDDDEYGGLNTLVLKDFQEQPDLIKQLGDFEEKYKNLCGIDKQNLLVDVFSQLTPFVGINTAKFFPQVADIFANNKSPVLRDIVGFSNGTGNEKQFKRVLDSLTPEKIQQIVKETNDICNDDYVDNYINQFKE